MDLEPLSGKDSLAQMLEMGSVYMINIDFRKFTNDHAWFGFVYNRHVGIIFLGWSMFFIPMRKRTVKPPEWYLTMFNIDYF
jgi:hypothetical protein